MLVHVGESRPSLYQSMKWKKWQDVHC